MNRRRTVLIVLLACATGFLIPPRAGSQPPTPAPPEIVCKHFLYGYPAAGWIAAVKRPYHPGLLCPEQQRRHEIRRLGLLLFDLP
jgi:hypothetical protein